VSAEDPTIRSAEDPIMSTSRGAAIVVDNNLGEISDAAAVRARRVLDKLIQAELSEVPALEAPEGS